MKNLGLFRNGEFRAEIANNNAPTEGQVSYMYIFNFPPQIYNYLSIDLVNWSNNIVRFLLIT